MERNFYRCYACLGVFAIDGQRVRNVLCDCGHPDPLDHMGKVQGDSLIKIADLCACDHRCTDAVGPHCNCKCGGANHGSHKVVPTIVASGAIPQITAPETLPARLAAVAEFRAAKEAARQRVEARHAATLDAMRNRRWVQDKGAWMAARDDQTALRKAGAYLIHGKRLSALAKIAA